MRSQPETSLRRILFSCTKKDGHMTTLPPTEAHSNGGEAMGNVVYLLAVALLVAVSVAAFPAALERSFAV